MTNNTDAQIAREWARRAVDSAENAQPVSRGALAAARHILATTTPPTMVDVEWDDEVHAGLCAEHCDGYEVLMLGKESWDDDRIYCRWTVHGEAFFGPIHKLHLTPIPGRKIDLTPRSGSEQEPTQDHPTELTTWKDYRNAPEGTIVAKEGGKPFVLMDELWMDPNSRFFDHWYMVGTRRRVLRWGWEA